MANIPVPQHVQLVPPGPHVLTTAEGFLGLAIVGAKLPVQLRFVLEDGVELHLPLTIEVCQSWFLRIRARWPVRLYPPS